MQEALGVTADGKWGPATQAAAGGLPHVLRDSEGQLYMCTARQQDVDAGKKTGSEQSYDVTSAAKSLGWAVKWIFMVESWLNGDISPDDAFGHVF